MEHRPAILQLQFPVHSDKAGCPQLRLVERSSGHTEANTLYCLRTPSGSCGQTSVPNADDAWNANAPCAWRLGLGSVGCGPRGRGASSGRDCRSCVEGKGNKKQGPKTPSGRFRQEDAAWGLNRWLQCSMRDPCSTCRHLYMTRAAHKQFPRYNLAQPATHANTSSCTLWCLHTACSCKSGCTRCQRQHVCGCTGFEVDKRPSSSKLGTMFFPKSLCSEASTCQLVGNDISYRQHFFGFLSLCAQVQYM